MISHLKRLCTSCGPIPCETPEGPLWIGRDVCRRRLPCAWVDKRKIAISHLLAQECCPFHQYPGRRCFFEATEAWLSAAECQIFWLECTTFDFNWRSAPDSAEKPIALPDYLCSWVVWEEWVSRVCRPPPTQYRSFRRPNFVRRNGGAVERKGK